MRISHEPHDKDAWVCICGNTPSMSGFDASDRNGVSVEPTPEEWGGKRYVCLECGRVIMANTLEVETTAEERG